METRLTDIERKKAAAKARVKRQRGKIYADPALLEEYRRKERERYQKRKLTGKLKSAYELDAKSLKRQQHKWRQNSARHYKRKKQLENILDLTPPSFNEDSPGHT